MNFVLPHQHARVASKLHHTSIIRLPSLWEHLISTSACISYKSVLLGGAFPIPT